MIDRRAQKSLEGIVVEFRRGIAFHRARGTSEIRISELLAASQRLALQQIADPELCAWLCAEFANAAMPIAANYPANRTRH
jgi:hypothetical protein